MTTQEEKNVDVQIKDLLEIKDQMLAQANSGLAMALAQAASLQRQLDALKNPPVTSNTSE